MMQLIEVNSIDDLELDAHGTIIVQPNTTYIFNNAIEIKYHYPLKRKIKRFNTKRYQTVVKAAV